MFNRSGCRKYLNKSERKTFRRAIHAERDLALRAFMLTIYHTSCRISEALNLLAGRIDGTANAVVFETLKRRKRGFYRTVRFRRRSRARSLALRTENPRIPTYGISRAPRRTG